MSDNGLIWLGLMLVLSATVIAAVATELLIRRGKHLISAADASTVPAATIEVADDADPVATAVSLWARRRARDASLRLPEAVCEAQGLAWWLASLRSWDIERLSTVSPAAIAGHMSGRRKIDGIRPWPTADEIAGRGRPTTPQMRAQEQSAGGRVRRART